MPEIKEVVPSETEATGQASDAMVIPGLDGSSPGLAQIIEEYRGKPIESVVQELNKIPFFMTELSDEAQDTPEMEALRALAYDGDPDEVAENFKRQGNDCFSSRRYKDASEYYRRALEVEGDVPDSIKIACYGNRAQCNLFLKNYRSAIADCNSVLQLDPRNAKAWLRSARAFMTLKKPQEAAACAELGVSNCENGPAKEELQKVLEEAKEAAEQQKKLALARQQREELAAAKKQTLKLAMDARSITRFYSEEDSDRRHIVGDLEPGLADPTDPSSELLIPVLALYPLKMESDIIGAVSEYQTIDELAHQLFDQPPNWADQDYTVANLSFFIQTSSGGLASISHSSTLIKALSSQKPDIIMVDGFARLFVVPKNKAKEWLGQWNKQQALAQLRICEKA